MILLDLTFWAVAGAFIWIIGGLLFLTLLPMIFIIKGFIKRRKDPDAAKKDFIKAGVFFLIGAGICGGPSLVIPWVT